MIGSAYIARIPSFSRDPAADEVLCRISAPSTGILLITRAWFGQTSVSNLNEMNAISFVRLSTDGTGGTTLPFEEPMESVPAFPGTGACLPTGGWTNPTVSGTEREFPSFNLATGFEWSAQSEDDYIVVAPSGRWGMRILVSPSVAVVWRGGVNLLYVGG